MVHIKTVSHLLCAAFFTCLLHTSPTLASEHTSSSSIKAKSATKNTSATKRTKSAAGSKKRSTTTTSKTKTQSGKNSATTRQTAAPVRIKKTKTPATVPSVCRKTRNGKTNAACNKLHSAKPATIAEAHKLRVQNARKTAMNKLMQQIGKPYHWGGTSPHTGFDCSGLVWYAYKDLVKIRIPRTANEMYHLRDAAPVNHGELQSGDLVFFQIGGRGKADHVGVYVGEGKFIQSPRSGRKIQITSLQEDYWLRHYVGARRVMTAKNVL